MSKISVLVRTLALLGLGFVSSLCAQVSFTADYEPTASGGTGDTEPGSGVGTLTVLQRQYFPDRAAVVNSPLAVPGRPGTKALFFETRQQDGNYRQTMGNRSELRFANQAYNNNNNTSTTEVWYAWSIFLPNNSLYDGDEAVAGGDADGGGREIHFQVHGPDGSNYQTSKRPPFAIQRQLVNGSVRWQAIWRSRATASGGSGPNGTSFNGELASPQDLGPCTTGEWTDFVVRIVWGNDGSTGTPVDNISTTNGRGPGSVGIWRDGTQILNAANIDVGYRDHPIMYVKVGIYAFDWNVPNQPNNTSAGNGSFDPYIARSYWDELKIVVGPSSYDAMKPRRTTGGTPPPPATVNGDGNLTGVKQTVAGAAVTASANDGNVPANTVDGNLATRWSAEGEGQWIRFDLGTAKVVTHLRLAWLQGNVRTTWFDVEASNDATSWTRIRGTAESAGNTTALETVDVQNVSARYVRLVGYGNSVNMWNSLTEAEVYAQGTAVPATPTALGATAISSTQINLTWTDNAADETLYKIERKAGSSGIYSEISGSLLPNTITYNDTSGAPSTTYIYRVRAANSAGNSAYSNEATGTTLAAAPITSTFSPSDDAYLEGSTRFNTAELRVENTSSRVRRSYFKFSVTGLGGSVTSATLRLRNIDSSNRTGTYKLYTGSATSWTESTLSTANAPTKGALLATQGSITAGGEISLNVGGLVTGNGTYHLIFEMDLGAGQDAKFNTDEAAVSAPDKPRLVLVTQ